MNFDLSSLCRDAGGFITISMGVWACIVGAVWLSGKEEPRAAEQAAPAEVVRLRRNNRAITRRRRIKRATRDLVEARPLATVSRAS